MKIIYRISDHGYNKVKPDYINNENCISNFFSTLFYNDDIHVHVICDNVSDDTFNMVKETGIPNTIERTQLGSGAQSFRHALDRALTYEDDDIVYFVEDDYLHKSGWVEIMKEGFGLGANYVTLYDHPDKYMNPSLGGNPFVQGGGEVSRVFLSKSCHWKLTNSTTMTFAARVKTLKSDESVLREYTAGSYPRDFDMFLKLRERGRTLISSIPGYSTHGETTWLSPHTDWKLVADQDNLTTMYRVGHGITA